jgi:hypothetical protein
MKHQHPGPPAADAAARSDPASDRAYDAALDSECDHEFDPAFDVPATGDGPPPLGLEYLRGLPLNPLDTPESGGVFTIVDHCMRVWTREEDANRAAARALVGGPPETMPLASGLSPDRSDAPSDDGPDDPSGPSDSLPAHAAPAAPVPPDAVPPVAPGDRWSKRKMTDFLRMLSATHNVAAAARSVGMSRQSAYKLRARMKGLPFDIAWEAAFRHGYDNLAHAALDRAINGVEVPHYHGGELVGTSRRYDERLTVALLSMRNRFGAPRVGRYGAAAEYYSERWDALLERIEHGDIGWRHDDAERDDEAEEAAMAALLERHAPDPLPRSLRSEEVRHPPLPYGFRR